MLYPRKSKEAALNWLLPSGQPAIAFSRSSGRHCHFTDDSGQFQDLPRLEFQWPRKLANVERGP